MQIRLPELRSLVKPILIGVLVLITVFTYADSQQLRLDNAELRQDLSEMENEREQNIERIEQLNSTLKSVRSRFDELKEENGEIKSENEQALIYLEYGSRSASSGEVQISFSVYNLGKSNATDITGECTAYREETDQSYRSFQVNLGQVEARTAETKQSTVTFTESISSSDEITCQATSCSGNCEPLQSRIETNVVNNPRSAFN